ncbi:MAG: 30S ribosomal protein S7 [Flavobacteriales bacterium]|jgi:small subunit ribosomal protein S7|nr:30S ribosomal protein S7 [Flavobacteriales bacterium]MDG1767647.1 30S ribosomal protein S7 [Flavobacteriales bacterium]MDP4588820.1 30S ribosomal protein S7 [Flavobacteriales bacterium]MDP4952816.1 30S ribosomal protein S7 [Flavobacteriales bacterium]
MRRKRARKLPLLPDPRFKSELVTQFVNNLMLDGKKNLAYKIFYEAVDQVSEKSGEDGLEVWKKALSNVTPAVEVRSRRVGGATFQIPQQIRDSRKLSMGMKWMIGYSRKRNEKTMADRLANEIMAASREEGATFKKKEDTHRMAEANKAFAHFRI